jgi:radical SAM protein with 4Fe4S-binding SPASM domain
MNLKEDTILFKPPYHLEKNSDIDILIDSELPNWIATDLRGAKIMEGINGRRTFGEIVAKYSQEQGVEFSKSWLQCSTLVKDALRCGFASTAPYHRRDYEGRGSALKLEELEELWLHLTNACNLTCTHCLVNSSPRAEKGISAKAWKRIIDESLELGTKRFYITGGEPFLREDIEDIVRHICEGSPEEIVILTNGTLLRGKALKMLSNSDKIELQISLEGSERSINDAVRGRGSFERVIEGIKNVAEMGFSPTVATTMMRSNIEDVPNITRLASNLGAEYHHLFFVHNRGRAAGRDILPRTEDLIHSIKGAVAAAEDVGIKIDNFEFAKHHVAGNRGVKTDLSNAAWSSLCVYCDGHVYPSASLAGVKSLDMGSALEGSLAEAWRGSGVAKHLRNATVQKKSCATCYLKFICGGGDVDHAYLYSANGSGGDFLAPDPFCGVHRELIQEAMGALARERRSLVNEAYDNPIVYCSMDEGALVQDRIHKRNGTAVTTNRSNCVLFLDVDRAREVVRAFYARAAEKPVEELCCAGGYSSADISHIPKEVLDISYGCGSPIEWADINAGEVVVDLGSGGGIDCFIAAKKVGAGGRVIGIDMTREMLEKAEKNKLRVAENLGYDVVEFRKGYLEEIPLPNARADAVLSNCVINLSPDKRKVFSEIWRVLKDHGRAVIADTLAEEEVPMSMRSNPRLWGECVSGALTEEEYLSYMERVGFYGLSVLKKSFWKEVEGVKFYSAVIRGYKLEKKGCKYVGQKAVYKGPFRAVLDEEGHLFPRGEAVEVCTDTAAKLKKPPYNAYYEVIEPGSKDVEYRCCDPGKGGPC